LSAIVLFQCSGLALSAALQPMRLAYSNSRPIPVLL